jgi:hypothetical protein
MEGRIQGWIFVAANGMMHPVQNKIAIGAGRSILDHSDPFGQMWRYCFDNFA